MNKKRSVINEITTSRVGMPATRYAMLVALVGAVAAIASLITVALSLQLWTMFIGWTCFSTGGGNVRRGAMAVVCLAIGVLLGMGSIVVLGAISPIFDQWSLAIVIFFLAVIAMLSLLTPPLDSVAGYFLGMTAFYASGLPPGLMAMTTILAAVTVGSFSAALTVLGPRLYERIRLGSANA